MTTEELIRRLDMIQKMKSETSTLELKSAEKGCPQHLYDSLSSFSNQDEGGIIIFGVDEKQDYKEVGVYDPQDIQKKINEQCLQMEPAVRPLLTVVEKDGKSFVSAEIPGVDLADRPVFYKGKGRLAQAIVKYYIEQHPEVTVEQLREMFFVKNEHLVNTLSEALKIIDSSGIPAGSYYHKEEDIVKVHGEDMVVWNYWPERYYLPFLEIVNKLGYKFS